MTRAQPVSLRIPEEAREVIVEAARRTGRDFSSVANEMLLEAVRMRRIPGILFADGPTGRRARVAGTGLDVFEVVRAFREVDQSWDRLRAAFDWISETQLRAALAYAEAYPEEIDQRLRDEDRWNREATWTRYPFMRPQPPSAG
jgi:uncharacterized protein (DUF433 family)